MTGSSIEAIAKAAGSTVLQATDVIWKTNVNWCWSRAKELLEMHLPWKQTKCLHQLKENTGVYVVLSTVKAPALKIFSLCS
jgi:peptidyl-prolyl cis-trans isomerase D